MRRVVTAILVMLALALVPGCGGDDAETTAPAGGSAFASRDLLNGAPQLTSSILVKFDRPVALASTQVPLASFFEVDVAYATIDEVKSERMQVSSAEFSDESEREVLLAMDRVVPGGSKLYVDKAGFEKDAEGTLEITIDADLDVLGALFATEALVVTNPAIVDAGVLPEATDADQDAAMQRQALQAHLSARAADDATVQRALAAFDGMDAAIVTSPKLRAALSALTGTFAEDAIASLLTDANCTGVPAATVAFQTPPGFPGLAARVTFGSGGARIVSINPEIEGERLEVLMPLLLHEAIHCDQQGGRFEEVAATALDTYMWLNLLATFPDLVTDPTPMKREYNVDAVAMINSGRLLPESIGILKSPGVDIAVPGTTAPYSNFADLVAAAYPSITYNESLDEPLAQAYVAQLAAAAGMAEGSAFSLVYLDELLARVAAPEMVQRAIIALGLTPAE